jgi:hypothetical protein
MGRLWRLAVAVVIGTGLLTGCTTGRPGQPRVTDRSSAAGQSSATGQSDVTGPARDGGPGPTDLPCSMSDSGARADASNAKPVPADFVPVLAHRCILTELTYISDAMWRLRQEQEATGPFDKLLVALRQPSEPRQTLPCPYVPPIDLTLTDSGGHTITPAIPEDFCGRPLGPVVAYIDALPWKTVNQTRVRI